MDQAVSSGLTVMRAMAFGVSKEYALETSPGQYSEVIFRGMDYMLDQARQRGIKVSPGLVVSCVQLVWNLHVTKTAASTLPSLGWHTLRFCST